MIFTPDEPRRIITGGRAPDNDAPFPLNPRTGRPLQLDRWEFDIVRREIINAPETADFMAGVPLEAAHQRERWGSNHDAGKTPFDWFWLIGYLAQKAADAATRGDLTKAQHHTISTAAALANWHAALTGADTSMRPGIAPPSTATALDREKGA
ncbi:hypothetical protein Q5H91_04020 [Sphingomonas sp. KR1UV-12]|uniref:dATP/dGTP diphosphohydrolase N-terminal domain-containing protein n=1 Tax=Sphingomonas aurea TaxID=3063994 RepID=A0ABT9EHT9_9SPHN|nr:hypothetical protein [Sphingomonas sp. KR1UV-12]MDP1026368.1 hypothetical protein [Sphingomonas sp. KR1UV-12]